MKYLSLFSGIEAATVAWHKLGWEPVGFSEIEPFPCAVLQHHYPGVINYGDITNYAEWKLPKDIDLIVGGSPCQSFSVAGLRKGLADPRGNLMLTYLAVVKRVRPQWVVWENVPGVLSSDGGRALGTFLGALGELGYGWAYRVLDAQWCRTHGHPRAVPQRRRRVFVVGCLGDWSRAAAVLFERESVQRDSSTRRTQGKGAAADAEAGAGAGLHETIGALCADTHPGAYSGQDAYTGRLIPQPVGYRWQNDREGLVEDGTDPSCRASAGRSGFHEMNHPVVVARDNAAVVNMQGSKSNACVSTDGSSFTLNAMHGHDVHAVAFAQNQLGEVRTGDVSGTLNTNSNASGRNTPMAAVAFTPGNLSRGAGPSPNAEVAPTQRCSAGRGADDQRTCVAFSSNMSEPDFQTDGTTPTVNVGSGLGIPAPPAVAFQQNTRDEVRLMNGDGQIAGALAAESGMKQQNYIASQAAVAHALAVRTAQTSANGHGIAEGVSHTLDQAQGQEVAFTDAGQGQRIRPTDQSSETLRATKRGPYSDYYHAMTVRRLTPRECERLQGFPDDWTLIPWRGKPADQCPDGPRYKALGNSMAVNCMAWIGERIGERHA